MVNESPRGGDLDLVTHDAQKRKDWLVLTLTRVRAETGEAVKRVNHFSN